MYDSLKSEFEETKQKLQDVEKTIRRITGRDPDQFAVASAGNFKFRNELGKNNISARKRNGPFASKKDNAQELESKQVEQEEEEEEESPDEDGSPKKKPALQSTIVANLKGVKTRRSMIEEQKNDRRIFARNRRMFGVMLGTLQKFQSEESRRREQAQKRAEIDKKLEEAAEKEKLLMKKEKEQLFLTRREKQTQIRCLEKKLEVAEIHEVWERNHNHLLNFIQTEAEPKIMFVPAKHNAKSIKSYNDSKEKILAVIESNAERVRKELEEIDEMYRKDDPEMTVPEDIVDKENIGLPESNPMKVEEEGEDHVMNGENIDVSNNFENSAQPDGKNETLLPENENSQTTDDLSNSVSNSERTEDVETDGSEIKIEKKNVDQEEFEPIYDE